jgi:hypothetical protein
LNGPTDVAFDAAGNIFISDGYRNSRIVKVEQWSDSGAVHYAGTKSSPLYH